MHKDIEQAFSLKDRAAVVSGAASGLGRQTAITFAQAGARVVVADIDESGLSETADLVRAVGGAVSVRPTNVADQEQVNALSVEAVRALGGIDVWVNAAGVILTVPIVDATAADLDRLLAVNLKGTYWGCAAAARVMTGQGKGSIINISSTGADAPYPGLSIYALTKASVNMLTRTLAHEVGPYGVRANAIAPGFIDTPMVTYRFRTPDGRIDEAQRKAVFEDRARASVLGITGEPSDIGFAMLYLASDASRFVTGQVLRANGGATMP